MKPFENKTAFRITIIALILCTIGWLQGLSTSDIWYPDRIEEKRLSSRYLNEENSEFQDQKLLAEAYYTRYPEIKSDEFYGENGPHGVLGAREHFRQHGKREGRIFAPLPKINDPQEERPLAEAYWQRYPDIAGSAVWGRSSAMGILGPRDHYRYVGKYEGRKWGIDQN